MFTHTTSLLAQIAIAHLNRAEPFLVSTCGWLLSCPKFEHVYSNVQ
jgi:hypothetical protein